jgi:hypothetical protein
MLGTMKNSMEQRKNSLSKTIGAATNLKSGSRTIKTSIFETAQPASTTSLNGFTAGSPLIKSGISQGDEVDE